MAHHGPNDHLLEQLHVSFSQVSTYLRCPEQFRLKYVHAAEPSHRSAELVFGSAIHGALAFYHEHLRRHAGRPAFDAVKRSFSDLWVTALELPLPILWPDDDSKQSLFDQGIELLKLYVDTVRIRRVVAVEKSFAVPLVDEKGRHLEEMLTGVVDLIEEDDNGQVWITEVKTAARRFDDIRLQHDHQLSVYAGARQVLGVPDARVRFRVLLKQKKPAIVDYEVPRQPQQVNESLHVVRQVLRAIDSRIFYPTRSWQCSTCAYRGSCGQ